MKLKTHTIVIMTGPSSAGKTFFCDMKIKELREKYPEYNIQSVSSDDCRRELLGFDAHKYDPKMMKVSKQAFELMHSKIDYLSQWPINAEIIFADATHLSKFSREKVIDIARKNGYNVDAIVFQYKKREEYFEYSESKRIVSSHVDKFMKNTVKELRVGGGRDLDSKHKVTSRDFDSFDIEIEDYGEVMSCRIEGNYFAIGDIHGMADKLKEALKYAKDNKLIPIILGDILDKGPWEGIKECIDILLPMVRDKEALFVRGNHENWIVKSLRGDIKDKEHEKYFDSIANFREDKEYSDKLFELFDSGKWFYLHENFIATHAPVKYEYLGKLKYWKRHNTIRYPKLEDYKSAEEWNRAVVESLPVSNEKGFPLNAFGHIAFSSPYRTKSAIGIDTGAVYGNYLTGVDLSRTPKIKKFFVGGFVSDGLVNTSLERSFNLDSLDGSDKGRILWAAKEGLPITSGTMCPADSKGSDLESLDWALDYFDKPVIQPKYMGSWSCVRLRREAEDCKTFSRNGHLLKGPLQERLIPAYQKLIDKIFSLDRYKDAEEIVLLAELLPWRFLGEGLIDKHFYGIGDLVISKNESLKSHGFESTVEKLRGFYDENKKREKKDIIDNIGHHAWSTINSFEKIKNQVPSLEKDLDDVKKYMKQVDLYGQDHEPEFKPFCVAKIVSFGGEEKICLEENSLFNDISEDSMYVVDKNVPEWRELAHQYFHTLTAVKGHEGAVVKPIEPEKYRAPYIKVRNTEYLRIVYGYDYERNLGEHLRTKTIKKKLSMSIKDWIRAKKICEIKLTEINEENERFINLIADFVLDEKKQEDIDKRL